MGKKVSGRLFYIRIRSEFRDEFTGTEVPQERVNWYCVSWLRRKGRKRFSRSRPVYAYNEDLRLLDLRSHRHGKDSEPEVKDNYYCHRSSSLILLYGLYDDCLYVITGLTVPKTPTLWNIVSPFICYLIICICNYTLQNRPVDNFPGDSSLLARPRPGKLHDLLYRVLLVSRTRFVISFSPSIQTPRLYRSLSSCRSSPVLFYSTLTSLFGPEYLTSFFFFFNIN